MPCSTPLLMPQKMLPATRCHIAYAAMFDMMLMLTRRFALPDIAYVVVFHDIIFRFYAIMLLMSLCHCSRYHMLSI